MRKVVYAERRSGIDRRIKSRRSVGRFFRECLKPANYRRRRTRRAFYIRRETYAVYEPGY
jgi:hypothetical protein